MSSEGRSVLMNEFITSTDTWYTSRGGEKGGGGVLEGCNIGAVL